MQLHTLSRTTPRKRHRQIGRGGKRGTTSGRGTKGQKARAGNKRRPEFRDILKKLPKRRGYGKNRAQSVVGVRTSAEVVNVGALTTSFSAGEIVSPAELRARGLIRKDLSRLTPIKLLGSGTLSVALTVRGLTLSQSAREKVLAAGGTVQDAA